MHDTLRKILSLTRCPCSPRYAEYVSMCIFASYPLTSPTTKSDYAITHNLTPFISMQNNYSLMYREEEREMFPTLKVPASSLPTSRGLSVLLFRFAS